MNALLMAVLKLSRRDDDKMMTMLTMIMQVMMKDLVTPVAVDEIRNVVRKCLENAALINYNKVNEMARAEGMFTLVQHHRRIGFDLTFASLFGSNFKHTVVACGRMIYIMC